MGSYGSCSLERGRHHLDLGPLGRSFRSRHHSALYTTGMARLWGRAGRGRGVQVWQVACFAGSLALACRGSRRAAALARRAPVCRAHDRTRDPDGPRSAASRRRSTHRRHPVGPASPVAARLGRFGAKHLPSPPSGGGSPTRSIATVLHGVALWAWHVPLLYDAALASDPAPLAAAPQLPGDGSVFLVGAAARAGRASAATGRPCCYLFATSLHTGFLGILLALARQPLYPLQTRTALEWGLTPLEDQQLAGLIMWVPAGLVYAVAALALAGIWVAEVRPRRTRRDACSRALGSWRQSPSG